MNDHKVLDLFYAAHLVMQIKQLTEVTNRDGFHFKKKLVLTRKNVDTQFLVIRMNVDTRFLAAASMI